MLVFREVMIPGLILITISIYYTQTRHLPLNSTIFPNIVMAAMGLLAIAIIIKASISAYRRSDFAQDPDTSGINQFRVPMMVALSAGFVAMLHVTSFMMATPVFLIGAFLFLGVRPLPAILIGVCGTAIYYLLFAVLLGLNL
jgi:ABC-type dipeptide/oligopeptide/nickel transport system permease subunit